MHEPIGTDLIGPSDRINPAADETAVEPEPSTSLVQRWPLARSLSA